MYACMYVLVSTWTWYIMCSRLSETTPKQPIEQVTVQRQANAVTSSINRPKFKK